MENHYDKTSFVSSMLPRRTRKRQFKKVGFEFHIGLSILIQQDMGAQGCTPSTWEAKAEGSGVQGHSLVLNKFKANLAYL